MAVGFRKSLFGFNSDDVIEYIERAQNTFNKREADLSEKLSSAKKELALSQENYEALMSEKQELEQKIEEFNTKYADIERLSENIGKLYLVAQANSKVIIDNSQKSAQISDFEVERNLYSIDEAHKSLEELRANITKTSENFVSEVDKLISSLTDTKAKINQNTLAVEEAKKEFSEIFASITEWKNTI